MIPLARDRRGQPQGTQEEGSLWWGRRRTGGSCSLGPWYSPTSIGPRRPDLNSELTRSQMGVSRGGSRVEGHSDRWNRVSEAAQKAGRFLSGRGVPEFEGNRRQCRRFEGEAGDRW